MEKISYLCFGSKMKFMKIPKQVIDDLKNAEPLGSKLSLFEIEDGDGNFHIYHIGRSDSYFFIGSMTNSGLNPSAWVDRDPYMSNDYYLDGLFEICQEAAMFNGGEIETEENGEVIL